MNFHLHTRLISNYEWSNNSCEWRKSNLAI